ILTSFASNEMLSQTVMSRSCGYKICQLLTRIQDLYVFLVARTPRVTDKSAPTHGGWTALLQKHSDHLPKFAT
ncbi:hypothetical protein ABVT39_007325, partial [Epinephelus coioides]